MMDLFASQGTFPGYKPHDPVHQDKEDGKWYFWLETWADREGPFDTEEQARFEFHDYIYELEVHDADCS